MADGAQTIRIDQFDITIVTNSDFVAASLDSTAIEITGDGERTFQTGANNGQTMTLGIANMSATGLAVNGNNVAPSTDTSAAISSLDAAIKTVSDERSKLGAAQNRLEHRIKNLDTSSENLKAAESRIRDVDMAKEMMNFTKNNILNQASQAMLAQANQQPQAVLQLLR
ncbi:flagellin [Bacillus sp. DTU_2020_1000418_1_SI_GHA_SEK_038]|nr:flagellin [Bacillus sp. DTU_2020_1000418_1_SI_GHA_SEK_038]WNS75081.1 flagellin [Bacillus sp. DTU_2020_1000418_1_SI_GHA_SEK_038]